jgi:hypothetical protein
MKYKEFLIVLGLSRSGTTLLASLLHAYPEIELRFEPWHSMQPRPPVFTGINWFDSFYSGIYGSKVPKSKFGGFKETFGGRDAITWTNQVLENIQKNSGMPIKIIIIVRDIIHTYLSNIGGYHKYWTQNSEDYIASADDFLNFSLPENIFSLQNLMALQQKYGGVFVSYKSLIEKPELTMNKLTNFLGLDYNSNLLEYYNHIDMRQVMGDKGIVDNPQLPSFEYYERRARDAEQFEIDFPLIKNNASLESIRMVVNYIDTKDVSDTCGHNVP